MKKLFWLAPLALLSIGCGGDSDSVPVQPGSGATLYLVSNGNSLLTTRANTPGVVRSRTAISGLQGGESIVGIDVRPANGQIYGLSSAGRLYRIAAGTGVATQVGSGTTPFTVGNQAVGFDFNPTVDRIRVVYADGTNFRMNPDTGATVDTDAGTDGVQGDTAINPSTESINGVAYTNSFAGATTTTLFALNSTSQLTRIGGENGAPSPNGGAVTTVGSLGAGPVGGNSGFDISSSGAAYAVYQSGAGYRVYSVNVSSGAATFVGALPSSEGTITGLTVVE